MMPIRHSLAIYDYSNTSGGESQALTLRLVSVALSYCVLLINEQAARKLRTNRSV